jgi:hypothetical protein
MPKLTMPAAMQIASRLVTTSTSDAGAEQPALTSSEVQAENESSPRHRRMIPMPPVSAKELEFRMLLATTLPVNQRQLSSSSDHLCFDFISAYIDGKANHGRAHGKRSNVSTAMHDAHPNRAAAQRRPAPAAAAPAMRPRWTSTGCCVRRSGTWSPGPAMQCQDATCIGGKSEHVPCVLIGTVRDCITQPAGTERYKHTVLPHLQVAYALPKPHLAEALIRCLCRSQSACSNLLCVSNCTRCKVMLSWHQKWGVTGAASPAAGGACHCQGCRWPPQSLHA